MRLRVRGCEAQASVPFFLMLALLLLLDPTGTMVYGVAAAAAHEAGHLWMLALCGKTPTRVRLTAFGAEITVRPAPTSYWKDAAVALAGPAANLIFALIFWIIGAEHPVSPGGKTFFTANCLLAFFNLLPVGPLDGGQALYCLLCLRISREMAERVVQLVSFIVVLPLAAAGFLVLFQSQWNFSLLLCSFYLLALLVLKRGRYDLVNFK